MADSIEVRITREVSESALFEEPIRAFFQRVMLAGHANVAQPGRVPIRTGRLRSSLAPGGGVTRVDGSLSQGFTAIVGTNVKNYPRALEKPETRDPHYRDGPSAGQSTAGWLSKTKPAVEDQIPGMLTQLAGDIRAVFDG